VFSGILKLISLLEKGSGDKTTGGCGFELISCCSTIQQSSEASVAHPGGRSPSPSLIATGLILGQCCDFLLF